MPTACAAKKHKQTEKRLETRVPSLFHFVLENRDGRADRDIVVDPLDVVLVHAHAAVRDGIARAEVIFGIRARIAQARMERIARAGVEADDRAHGVGAGRPAARGLIGDRRQAGGRWRGGCARADKEGFDQLPIAFRALEYVDVLVGAIDPDKVLGLARIAFGIDPDFLFIGLIIVVDRIRRGVIAAIGRVLPEVMRYLRRPGAILSVDRTVMS